MFTPDKTLVIRFSSIGDIVLSSPLLRVLRARFPKSQIDYVTRREYAELVKFNHNLNFTYEFDTMGGFEGLRRLKKRVRDERYDLVIDIHNSIRSRYLRSMRSAEEIVSIDKRIVERTALVKLKKNLYKEIIPVEDRYIEPLKKFGIENDGKGPELHIPDEILFDVSGKMATLQLSRFEKVIGLCPSSKHETKRWPQDRFVEVGIRLGKKFDAKVLVFGGEGDRRLCSSIADSIVEKAGPDHATNFSGQFSLLQTAAAMEYCDVIITNDSGLMHIASAMKKKLVAIFGSTVREFGFFPTGPGSIVIERTGLYCRPCSHIGRRSCPEGHFRCMNEIGVDEVSRCATELVSGN
ncbi:MAG: lipopolysaccharide heptosyltransferase II [Bacteroidota bacterium]